MLLARNARSNATLGMGGDRRNEMARVALAGALTFGVSLVVFAIMMRLYPVGIDAATYLAAAGRWLAGTEPYAAAAFLPGSALPPFLYPPFVLPFIAPALMVPEGFVLAGWIGVCGLAAAVALWRLGVPKRWVLPLLVWPPFVESILGGNVQTILFLLFVLAYTDRPRRDRPWLPVPRGEGIVARRSVGTSAGVGVVPQADRVHAAAVRRGRSLGIPTRAFDGVFTAIIAAVKISQSYGWINQLRHRPRSALAGLSILCLVVLVTLPAVGTGAWGAWLAQIQHATSGTWDLRGCGLDTLLPPVARPLLVACGAACALMARDDDAGASVGLLMVVFGQAMQPYMLLYLIPAMLRIRRDVALLAAMSMAASSMIGIWIGVAIVAGALIAERRSRLGAGVFARA
jgi:hypothetical protein